MSFCDTLPAPRVAVTDYDGTLCLEGCVGDDTIAAIERWREAGNAFGIATGRDLSLITHETNRRGIPFDFLICANGAAIYDGDLNPLMQTVIPDTVVPDMLRHPASRASMHLELCVAGALQIYVADERSWFPTMGVPYREISYEEALDAKNLQQISLAYDTFEECTAYTAAVAEAFGNMLNPQTNDVCLDITRAGTDKCSGILSLLSLKGWPERGLLAIGDGGNDLPMIRRFGGFTVATATDEIKAEATGIYTSVGELLRDNMR